MGKGMGGGMPIAAFVASRDKMKVLSHSPVLGHITTFGGHPVSASAALATLDTLLDSHLIEEVERKSELFENLLSEHPAVMEVRRVGLMIAMDLGDTEKVQKVIQYGLENGVVADWFLFNTESIRISPPLIITEEEIKQGCTVLLEALDTL